MSLTSATPHDSISPVLRAMQVGQHVLFVLLVALGTARAAQSVSPWAWAVGAALLVWYGFGVVLARRRMTRLAAVIWLGALVVGWLAAMLMSADYSWVAFAIFLLCMHLLPTRTAIATTAGLTGVVITAQILSIDSNRVAQVAGPIFGAAVAVGFGLAYRQLLAERAELARAQHAAGVLAERERLSRDIHDTLAQGLSSIVLLARAGQAREEAGSRTLHQIEATAQENLEEARRVVRALAPAELEAMPLVEALQRAALNLEQQTGIIAAVLTDGDPIVLDQSVEVTLLRVAQSALANARQHAEAQRIAVTLTYDASEVSLDVVDNGIGFDCENLPSSDSGYGLRAMRDRLTQLGGILEIESSPGGGTALAARIPLTSEATRPDR
ncbi:MAG: sensor histidine kinase [Antricoccus sp.]